jgi:ribosomal protein S11
LSGALAELPGKFVALDRKTNTPVAAADSPDRLAAEIRSRGLRNVTVVRAPDPSEPELVGLG